MDASLSPEERAALQAPKALVPPAAVESRDFRTPRRLAPEHCARIKRVAQRAQLELEAHFQGAARGSAKVEIAAVTESSVAEVLHSLADPLAVLIYETGGHTSWCVLDSAFAVAYAERMLGAPDVHPTARRLSSVETGLVRSLLTRGAQIVLQALGTEPKNPRYVQDLEALHLAQELPAKADPQRLCVHVTVDTSFGTSTVRMYTAVTPAVVEQNTPAPTPTKAKPTLPPALVGVEVELHAELGAVELPLDQVLNIETGDVIPLDIAIGAPVQILIEDEVCGQARWGERNGKSALRITDVKRRA